MRDAARHFVAAMTLLAYLALLHLVILYIVGPETPAPAWAPPEGCWVDECARLSAAPGALP